MKNQTKNKAFISVFTKFVCLFFVFLFSSAYAQQKIEIGVRAINGEAKAMKKWSATADYLTLKIPNYQFEIVPIVLFEDMQKAVENKQLDFVLTNPSAYIGLQVKYGVYSIATLLNGRKGNGLSKFGEVVFTRADRKDLNSLKDIRGHSVMGVDTVAFGGWQMLYRKLLEMNIDPYQDCSQVLFSRTSTQNDVVFDVLNGKADFGTVRTGILENLVQQELVARDSIKIINPVRDSFPYFHTTRLYSEWTFSALKNTDKRLTKKITVALLQINKADTAALQGGYCGWEIPQNYSDVYDLLQSIKAPPFDQEEFSFSGFFLRYWIWFLIVFLIIMGLALVSLYNRILNKKLATVNKDLEQKIEKRSRELLKAQQDWENIFNSISSPAQLIDKQHKIKYVNQATLDVFEMKEEDLIGKSCFTLFHDSDSAPLSCPLVKALQEGKSAVEEMVFEGLEQVFIVSCSPIYNSAGNIDSFMHIMTDISERKVMEKQLAESRQHFETLFNFGVEAVFVHPFSEEGFQKFIEVNPVACRLFGYSKEEFLNLSASDISSQADVEEKGSNAYRQQLNKERNLNFEAVMIKRSGEKFPVEISSTTFDYHGQRVIMSVVRDLTEHKKAELELQTNREYIQTIFDSSSDVIFVHDAETGAILDVNQQFKKLYGFEKEEVLNGSVQPMSRGESPYSDKEVLEWLGKSKTEGKQIFEWQARHKDGHLFWVEVSIVYVPIGGENRFLASVRNIEERKKAKEALEKSEEKYRAAFESSMDAITISRVNDGVYVNVNKGFMDITGYTESDVIGKTSIELNIWADPKDREKLVETIKTKGYINNLEALFLAKDGSEIAGLMSANVISINQEDHVLSVTRDITDRKKVDNELREYRLHLEKLVRARTHDLEEKNQELVRMNKLFVGRENRMAELKEEIERLKKH
jgi:PAS domain S-box-containing protein